MAAVRAVSETSSLAIFSIRPRHLVQHWCGRWPVVPSSEEQAGELAGLRGGGLLLPDEDDVVSQDDDDGGDHGRLSYVSRTWLFGGGGSPRAMACLSSRRCSLCLRMRCSVAALPTPRVEGACSPGTGMRGAGMLHTSRGVRGAVLGLLSVGLISSRALATAAAKRAPLPAPLAGGPEGPGSLSRMGGPEGAVHL